MTTLKTSSEIFAANQVLTVEIAKSLLGQRIQTVYSGYRGQDGDENFVIGQVVSELEYYRNLKEECYQNNPKFKNRAEYWESYMTEKQLSEHRNKMVIITADGRNTFIYAHSFNDGSFTCSDSDRFVYYIAVNQIKAVKSVNMFDTDEVAIIEGKYYAQLAFEKLSTDSQKRLKGCVGVIDERGKEQWFTPEHFQL